MMQIEESTELRLNLLVDHCHRMAREKGFWEHDPGMAEKIALMHSELSELLEAARAGTATESEKIPGFSEAEEECADLLIRLLDFCGGYDVDLGGATVAKIKYNATRPHKHGKKF